MDRSMSFANRSHKTLSNTGDARMTRAHHANDRAEFEFTRAMIAIPVSALLYDASRHETGSRHFSLKEYCPLKATQDHIPFETLLANSGQTAILLEAHSNQKCQT
jgi:hypothetical protein